MTKGWLLFTLVLGLLLRVPASGAPHFFAEHTIKGNGFVGANCVYATDVDGDGDTDVLATAYTNGISWWENTGGTPPNLTEHIIRSDFTGAMAVYATDVDGDGDTDVLGAAELDNDISWWENTGGTPPNFTEHSIADSTSGARSVHAADVDGDGDTDVLGARGADITWWENRLGEAIPWIEHSIADSTFYGANSAYATDVDGDGDTDVLGAARSSATEAITWWENVGGTPINWDRHVITDAFAGANSVYATDVDGDGDTDVLGAAGIVDSITWWENRLGEPTPWIRHTIDDGVHNASSIYATDVDGDGDIDVLGAAWGIMPDYVGRITWWENRLGEPTAWISHTIEGTFDGARSVYATDVDGDGDTDVLGAAELDDDVIWWENDPSGNAPPADPIDWTEHSITDGTFNGAASVHAADVDGDGDVDVLGAAGQGADITWWENRLGEATPWIEHPVADSTFYGANSAYATDVDGDGNTDVLGAAWGQRYPRWWENKPSGNLPPSDPITWTQHEINDVSEDYFEYAGFVCANDVDGDGDVDVLGAGRDIIWWENGLSGNPPPADPITWTVHPIADSFWASSVYATDVDGDGDTDVVGASSASSYCITWWENDGSENFTEHTIKDHCQAAWSVFATDVDGDTDVDVLGAATLGITWWESHPSGNEPPADPISWTEHTIKASPWVVDVQSVYATDVDVDGDVDVLGAEYHGDKISWWENRLGDPTPWIEHTIRDDLDGARSVYATDVDGDGDVDVLGAAMLADAVIWWENRSAEKTYVPLALKNYGP